MNQSKVTLAALVGLLVLATATHISADKTDNELQFKARPEPADGAKPSAPANNGVNPLDNNINNDVDDDKLNENYGQQQQQQPGQWSSPTQEHGRRPSLDMPPFPLFGRFSSPNDFRGPSDTLTPSLWSPPNSLGRLFRPLDDIFDRMHHRLSRVFEDMEQNVVEGEKVSYFRRNNVAFKTTCITERVDPDGQKQQFVPDNRQIDQQAQPRQPQQQQPQQQQPQQQEQQQQPAVGPPTV